MPDPEPLVDPENRRKYVRLESCYPVEFSIVRLQGDLPGISCEKGFTQNVSEGGLCLETASLEYHVFKYLIDNHIYLELKIQAPLPLAPIKAIGEARWFRETTPGHYMIGINFRSIPKDYLGLLIGQTRWINCLMRVAVVLAAGIVLGLIGFGIFRASVNP